MDCKIEMIEKFIKKGINLKQAEIMAKVEENIHNSIKKLLELDRSNDIIEDINIFNDLEIKGKEVIGFTIYPCIHDTIGFSTIPDIIGELKSLQRLKIVGFEGNGLLSFPESLTSLKSLKSLTINDNTITTIPKSIEKLDALYELNLAGNNIAKLPESIGELKSLKILIPNGS